MGEPSVDIIFKEAGITAAKRGTRGVVALILKDTMPANYSNPIKMDTIDEIPEALSEFNKEQIKLAMIGYQNPPKQVIAYIEAPDAANYSEAQNYLETIKWDYVVVPSIGQTADGKADTEANITSRATDFATWIKQLRSAKDIRVKAVLPHCPADSEGVINFATDDIKTAARTYTAAEYCSRIAGMLAGTSLNISATYAPLAEVVDVPHLKKEERDAAIDAGKLILINDGKKVKIDRAVNSFVTTIENKGEDFKKIKIVDIMDLIHDDIKSTAEDNYIGKYPNDYDHKCLLIAAINGYFEGLELDGLLDSSIEGQNIAEIDLDAQKAYLKSQGIDISAMKDQEIKESNTGSQVFVKGQVVILDAIEDIKFQIYI
ncbi:phage tail sheath subtilisin-like domain-containing protein [Clostridium beijerinckii]|uniref:phage tail sheath subtilisin-like domain-containing protein n=1 Tax=Clostridium beijerinckii TaxID=1520 RepID=UPI0002E783A7|nr:phage tail sheath subtilisin-like domain-containing protein [Clostridium beijerinckii]